MEHLFDIAYIKRNTPDYKQMPVALKKFPKKGTGLVANKAIKKNEVLAYYLMTVYSLKGFRSATKDMYTFTVYTKKESESKTLIGDLSPVSLPPPCNGVPFWGYFANEPSGKQVKNSYIDINTKDNYKNRASLKAGDTMVYVLRASKDLKKGEEIVWCYGEGYRRNYKPNC